VEVLGGCHFEDEIPLHATDEDHHELEDEDHHEQVDAGLHVQDGDPLAASVDLPAADVDPLDGGVGPRVAASWGLRPLGTATSASHLHVAASSDPVPELLCGRAAPVHHATEPKRLPALWPSALRVPSAQILPSGLDSEVALSKAHCCLMPEVGPPSC